MLILLCITALSCVSSFTIYREGFSDFPYLLQQTLALFAVVVVEGSFVWLVYGFTRAFSSGIERLISLAGMFFLAGTMVLNLVTHFEMAKRIELSPFQVAWVSWGAVTVFIAVLAMVLIITLADPVIRLIRLELRYKGRRRRRSCRLRRRRWTPSRSPRRWRHERTMKPASLRPRSRATPDSERRVSASPWPGTMMTTWTDDRGVQLARDAPVIEAVKPGKLITSRSSVRVPVSREKRLRNRRLSRVIRGAQMEVLGFDLRGNEYRDGKRKRPTLRTCPKRRGLICEKSIAAPRLIEPYWIGFANRKGNYENR